MNETDIPKSDEEIMNRFDECDEDDFIHGYRRAKTDFAKALAERDARIKELEAENDRLLHELSDATWREAKVQGELSRIKEGIKNIPKYRQQRGFLFQHEEFDFYVASDLDKLMKGGE